mgnify:CR=1 FL=1
MHFGFLRFEAIKYSWLVFLLLFGLNLPASASSPVVYTSIKPVAMLVKAVVGDDLDVKVLLPESASPHDYALKFSDLRALREADLFVWVGPELESVLAKALRGIPEENQMSLAGIKNIHWPEYLSHSHHGEHHHSDHEGHDDEMSKDPHLWLSPENSLKVGQALFERLSDKYPQFKSNFAENLRIFSESLVALDDNIRQQLKLVKKQGFIVLHDGYGHFVDHYGLNQLAVVQLNSGASRGARHYSEMVALGDQVACVFTEPQLNSKSAVQLAQTLGARHAELDFMGSNVTLSHSSYLELLTGFAETFTTCLR